MRILWMMVVLLSSMAWSQVKAGTPASTPAQSAEKERAPGSQGDDKDKDDDDKPAVPAAGAAARVDPNAAVLTIDGVCRPKGTQQGKGGSSSKAPACQTVVTRAQFESLVMTLMPGMSPQSKLQFAHSYPRLLAMADAAEARGLSKTKRFEVIAAFARLQILSQELTHELKEEAAKVTDDEIAAYYRKHPHDFQRATLERIFVPARVAGAPNAADDAVSKQAEELRVRAVAGEDFTKLQKAAYEGAGFQANPPSVLLEKLRRSQVPPEHAFVFDLKPGGISQVFRDSRGAYVYKLDSTEQLPLEETKAEIRKTLERQRMQDGMEKLDKSFTTKMNPAYFGTPEPDKGEKEEKDEKD